LATTVLPPPELLPDVLPTERLTRSGMPIPGIRAELRRIPDARNALTVVVAHLQAAAVLTVACWLSHPLAWAAAFLVMGRVFACYAVLAHEGAHRLLFTRRRVNDVVGKWLLAYPAFVPFDAYRRAHMAHHRDELGPNEPDLGLYRGYPTTWRSMARKLRRDALFVSGWKNLRPLLKAVRSRTSRPVAVSILGVQAVVLAVCAAFGRPELYLFMWLAPWMTVWRVLNRLRAIAEHGGMTRSGDRRLTTHHVRQGLVARFFMVPYRTGWHLAHHVDMGVPFRNLPRLHAELAAAGWVPADLEHPSYRALWRRLASAPASRSGAPGPAPAPADAPAPAASGTF
jgi:fatty acid desaturase